LPRKVAKKPRLALHLRPTNHPSSPLATTLSFHGKVLPQVFR